MSESAVLKTKFGNAKVDNKGYYAITSRKEGNNRKFLHRLVFEDYYNIKLDEEFPEGVIIHHEDGNKLNNEIWNLVPIPRADHALIHRVGQKHTEKNILKMMKLQNKTGFYRVGKYNQRKLKQGFDWKYQYINENGKSRVISSINLVTLKEKVLEKGLEWEIIDLEKAKKTLMTYNYDLEEFLS